MGKLKRVEYSSCTIDGFAPPCRDLGKDYPSIDPNGEHNFFRVGKKAVCLRCDLQIKDNTTENK